MADVARSRGTAGLTVVSTFSGCGGSCLGFEMAGYRVLWANEFLPIAQESYAANHPETLLDRRDIRRVEASQILDAIGLKPGELDVFNGSPPCQAFSTVGQRNKGWGKLRDYGNGVQQKNENLFFEYVRLLKGLRPRAFVAENVSGLTRGFALGFFKEIMRALEGAGYAVRCKVLDAQWLGVPQTRQRAIFCGVRKDIGFEPEFPKPLPYQYTLRDVLPGLLKVSQISSGQFAPKEQVLEKPCPCILSAVTEASKFKVIDRVVHDTGNPGYSMGEVTNRPCPAIVAQGIRELHIYERDTALSPKLERQWADRALRQSRQFGDSQRLICPAPGQPAPAILTNAGMFAHPKEPRRFTIDECKMICSFPADYFLAGSYAKQWARLGNAVPPMMMRAIAGTLRDGLFAKLGRTRAGFVEAR
jgi:DNA (cytosine-5)-methyltransferase 1